MKTLNYFKLSIWATLLGCIIMFASCDLDSKQDVKTKAKISKAIEKRDFNAARELCSKLNYYRDKELKEIDMAEINYVLDQNGVSDAYYLANELNAKNEFFDVVSRNIMRLLQGGQGTQLIYVLAGWTFEYTFDPEPLLKISGNKNDCYNKENNKFNALLDAIVNFSILNEDNGLIKKAIKLYRPTAIEKSSTKKMGGHEYITYKLVDDSKNAAIARANENGIEL